jgi:hypothetical protein
MRAVRNREVEQMSTRFSKHIRSNILGLVAIFITLGGTAYATHPGGEKTISSLDIIDDEVFSADVADDTLAGGGLAAADLRSDSVGTSEVAPDSLTSADLATSSVGSTEIIDGQVTNPDLGSNSVTGIKVALGSLHGTDIAQETLSGNDILDGSLHSSEIAADTLTSSDIGASAVGSSEVANGSLGTAEFASSIPAVHVTRTGNQGVLHDTGTPLNFNSERYDTASMHSNASNLNRLTAPVTGIYEVTANIMWAAGPFGFRSLYLQRNGTTLLADETEEAGSAPAGAVSQIVSTEVRLTAGQYVEAEVFQNSGGTRSILSLPEASPEFSMTWVAPGP